MKREELIAMQSTEFVRPNEASKIVKLSTSTLAKMRMYGTGPKFTKSGPKIVLYKVSDLIDWLASRSRRSTSEYVDVKFPNGAK